MGSTSSATKFTISGIDGSRVDLTVTAGDYKVGEVVNVPVGTKHRVENRNDEDLKFIEVQVGTYFGEDDIVRLEDDYGREGTNV